MEKKNVTLTTMDEFPVDLNFHNVPACLIAEFAEKVVKPYYGGDLNAAFQGLVCKAIAEQDLVKSRLSRAKVCSIPPT